MAQKFANAARSALAANITDVATSLTVDIALADLFPVADTDTDPIPTVGKDYFKAVLQNTSGDIEIVYVRTRALGSATFSNMIRGQEGTTAIAFLAGSIVGLRHTAEDLADAIDLAAGATVSGKALLNATSVAAQRTALGVGVTGDSVFQTATPAAARAVIGQRPGSIEMWPVATPPSDALLCNGAAVSRATYAALFEIISTTYGVGDGSTTFNVPDFRDRMPIGAGTTYAANAVGGSKDAVVVTHNHTATSTEAPHEHTKGGIFALFGAPGVSSVLTQASDSNTGSTAATVTTTVDSAGVSGTNANLPPYRGIYFIINT